MAGETVLLHVFQRPQLANESGPPAAHLVTQRVCVGSDAAASPLRLRGLTDTLVQITRLEHQPLQK